ncbi:MAG: hypothetical protein E7491_08590 [Ruminococcaceae bacterium]|nr:hypothetical protein [Oscillospiraceae bacterium]
MKKFISLVMAIMMLATLLVGFTGSATENLIPIDEEAMQDFPLTAYFPGVDSATLPLLGRWINGDPDWKDIISFDSEVKKFGDYSVKISYPNKNIQHGGMFVVANSTMLEKGKTYTFQAYVKTNKLMTMDSGAFVEVMFVDSSDNSYPDGWDNVSSERISGTKDWTLISTTFTANHVEEGIFLKLACSMNGTMSGTAWFDGMALVEGDQPVKDYESLVSAKPADPTPAPAGPTLNGEPSAWAKEEILKALEADLVPAHVNSNYTTDITRSDFCDLIIKMIEKKSGKAIADVIAGYADAKAEVSFPDTDSANVIAAAKLGIVNGRSSGAFDPTANITRQEAAKMLALAAKVLGADITASEVAFADADDIYAWAKEFIYYVNTIGVMNGTSTTTPPNFSPLRTYTREQSILTVYRLFNAL